MRIVLDTNVLIAALIARRGACAALLEHCVLRHTLVSAEPILDELQEHLLGKFKYSVERTDEAMALMRSQMELVVPAALEQPVCRDPDDDIVLAIAISGQAECLITGDKDLLVIQRFQSIEIISPAHFAAFEASKGA